MGSIVGTGVVGDALAAIVGTRVVGDTLAAIVGTGVVGETLAAISPVGGASFVVVFPVDDVAESSPLSSFVESPFNTTIEAATETTIRRTNTAAAQMMHRRLLIFRPKITTGGREAAEVPP